MRPSFSPLHLIVGVFILAFLIAALQVGALTLAFDKLGLSQSSAMLLLFSSVFGSMFNIPLFKMRAEASQPMEIPPWLKSLLRTPPIPFRGYTVIAVNFGGCLLPLAFSLFLIGHSDIPPSTLLLAVIATSTISYVFSRPLHGVGIGMPILIAPFSSALVALLLSPEHSAPLAYICGTLGVIIGADILRLKDIRQMGAPVASIGGAGTFDGIFITGIVAVLLT